MTVLEENTYRAIININRTLNDMLTLFKAIAQVSENKEGDKNE